MTNHETVPGRRGPVRPRRAGRLRSHGGLWAAAVCMALAGGCVDTLPAEDLRITTAVPAAKLSTTILWRDFEADGAAARARYWGKAVEITGLVARASAAGEPDPHVMFLEKDDHGVRAFLIGDGAPALLEAARPGERMTLKCFCHGLAEGDLVLRSCVRP